MVCAIAAQKPALKGEVAMSDSELTEGLHRGCSFFPQPLSRLAATAPRPGSLLVQCKHIVQCRTPRGAIVSMGLRGVQGGLRGEIEISPGPLAKKGYNVALGSMFVLTPSENSLTANFQLPLRGSLLVYFINSCDKPPSPREEDFAKQKTEGVGLPPQFSPNR